MTMYQESTARYAERWRGAFDDALTPLLREGMSILDIGSGREPTLAVAARPAEVRYVGLDVSAAELDRAGAGAYDDVIVEDVVRSMSALMGRFDLVLSWQVLEHVKLLDVALANIHSYLRPGGALVAQLSGKFSAFGVINQLIPARIGVTLLERLTRRDPGTVFPAYYDRCYQSALERLLASWSRADVTPRFRGASYFSFSPRARRAYLRYEDWAMRSGRANLATHYLVVATK